MRLRDSVVRVYTGLLSERGGVVTKHIACVKVGDCIGLIQLRYFKHFGSNTQNMVEMFL